MLEHRCRLNPAAGTTPHVQIGRITLHQKTIWMLKSFLRG